MRRVIVVVLGLALVLVGLDFAARTAAQAAVARQVQTSEGLSRQPTVDISGFPFLLQAARGDYREVDVQLQEVPAGGELRLEQLNARLLGVRLPLSALFAAASTDIPVDAARVTGTVSYAELDARASAALAGTSATAHFADGGNNRLRVTVDYTGPGGPLTLSGTAKVTVSRGRLAVGVPDETLAQVPQLFRATLAPLLSQTVQLPKLPFGLVPSSVTVTGQGVTVTADAQNAVLPAGQRTRTTG
jgi:hypothetical protein